MARSNCVIFALRQWQTRGGWIVVRPSRYGWWWHMEWSPDLVIFHSFDPIRPKRRRLLPPLWFEGKVRVYQPARNLSADHE